VVIAGEAFSGHSPLDAGHKKINAPAAHSPQTNRARRSGNRHVGTVALGQLGAAIHDTTSMRSIPSCHADHVEKSGNPIAKPIAP
jgi:hypothetical protein